MIYISTGGYSNLTLLDSVNLLLKNGFNNLELSGCRWSSNDIDGIKRLKSGVVSFQPHNYFPTQEIPFVLNLASLNEKVREDSLRHCEKAILLAAELGQKYYSVHAGFLMDPKVDELGKKIKNRPLSNRDQAIEMFIKNIKKLMILADKNKIRLLIENNVLNQNNNEEFPNNPLLMVDPKECEEIMGSFSQEVGMLLDVAHLKVSSNTLKFPKEAVFSICNKYIEGYHLSDNNGLVDENKSFDESSWFWKHLKPNLNYVSIEVYTTDFILLKNLLKITNQKLVK